MAFDKNPFVLDWDEAISLRKKKQEARNKLKTGKKAED